MIIGICKSWGRRSPKALFGELETGSHPENTSNNDLEFRFDRNGEGSSRAIYPLTYNSSKRATPAPSRRRAAVRSRCVTELNNAAKDYFGALPVAMNDAKASRSACDVLRPNLVRRHKMSSGKRAHSCFMR